MILLIFFHFRFVEAFAIFCGMAIRNAADYEKAVVSEAKLQVAFEVMNRYALTHFLLKRVITEIVK